MGRDVSMILRGVLLGGTLLLGACTWHGPVPVQTYPDLDPTSSVLAVDKAAWKLVALRKVQTEREADGRLRITLELNNLSAKDLPVQIQTVFRDGEGNLYGDETNWQMITLPGGADHRYEIVSLNPAADDFRVQVRTP